MSVLKRVSFGKQPKPMIHVLYGINGVGKSTFAAGFPNAIFLDLEKGSNHLDVARVTDLPNLAAFCSALNELLNDTHEYKTLVIDSIEALEALIFDFVCKEGGVTSIEDYGKGFGKGYVRSRELMRDVMATLRALNEQKQMTVIMIGHAQEKIATDAVEQVQYTRYTMRVNDKMASLIRDLSDNVFFATHKQYFSQNQQGKTKAFSQNERVMMTEWRSAYDAKNRMGLPNELPLSYAAFSAAASTPITKSVDQLRAEVLELTKGIKDTTTHELAVKRISEARNVVELNELKNRVHDAIAA